MIAGVYSGRPFFEGMTVKVHVEVPLVVGDLRACPVWKPEGLVFGFKFDFRDDKAVVRSLENVNLPGHPGLLHPVADFVDGGMVAKRFDHFLGILQGNLVIELPPGDSPFLLALDGNETPASGHPDTDGTALIKGEITLAVKRAFGSPGAPAVVQYEKFPFDFEGHFYRVQGFKGSGVQGKKHSCISLNL